MKKTIWITGTLLAIGIVVILVYFSFFQEKGSGTTPEGTFVKEVGDGMRLKAASVPERIYVKDIKAGNEMEGLKAASAPEGIYGKDIKEAGNEMEGLRATLAPERTLFKGVEIEWLQSA